MSEHTGNASAADSQANADTQQNEREQFTGLGYEQARDQLIDVVQGLEAGGLSLEDSLALWEKGEALAQVCERHLDSARQRIEATLASADGPDTGADTDADTGTDTDTDADTNE